MLARRLGGWPLVGSAAAVSAMIACTTTRSIGSGAVEPSGVGVSGGPNAVGAPMPAGAPTSLTGTIGGPGETPDGSREKPERGVYRTPTAELDEYAARMSPAPRNVAVAGTDSTGSANQAGVPRAEPAFPERTASEALDRLGDGLRVRRERRGAVITIPSDDLVEPGQWVLTSRARSTLDGLGRVLRNQYGHAIIVQGYTDSSGTAAANDALSLRRAEAVREYLVAGGIVSDRIQAVGLGARKPVAENGTPDGRASNRRIEIVIAP
jgi:outer membrane protein OmpA-like peptidoglycan-associated protein